MATELGVAYLSLAVESKGVAKDVQKAMGGVESAGDRAGSRIGSSLKTGLKVVGGAIAGVTGLVAGLALTGGVSRALAIEDAQAKLKGLGHDVESVQTIMDSALASVKGTAFGLGDAATVAASVVAAGVQPGEDLTRTLKLVADASTIAGTSMSDMGLIFNKVASTGKIQGEVIAQLGERGIPILQLLGEQLGVSAAEVSKLASEGKVDFETFQAAMEAGMGGAALESGNTFRGAMANTMAALGRLGEKVVGGVLPQLKGGFGEAIAVLDTWAPHAERVGQVVGGVLQEVLGGVRAMFAAFQAGGSDVTSAGFAGVLERIGLAARFAFDFIKDTVVPTLASLGQWVARNRDWLSALGVAVLAGVAAWKAYMTVTTVIIPAIKAARAAILALNVAMRANPIGIVITAITALVAGLVWFFTQTETGKRIVENVWGAIQDAVASVVSWFQGTVVPFFEGLWSGITTGWNALVDAWNAIYTGVSAAIGFIGSVVQAGIDRVKGFIDAGVVFIRGVWEGFWNGPFGQLLAAVWDLVTAIVETGIGLIRNGIETGINAIRSVWESVWGAVSGFFEATWNKITGWVEEKVALTRAVITLGIQIIRQVWERIWGGIRDFASRIWDSIYRVIEGPVTRVRDTVVRIVTGVRDKVSEVFNRIKGIASEVWGAITDTIRDRFDAAVGIVTGVVDRIRGAFSGAKDWLLDAGRKIIQGLIDGIKGMIGKVTDAVGDVAQRVRDFFPFSPAKRGPFSGRGAPIYSGQAVGRDFAAGMLSQRAKLGSAAGEMMGAAALVPNRSPIPAEARNPLSGSQGGSGVTQINHISNPDPDAVLDVMNARLGVVMAGAR